MADVMVWGESGDEWVLSTARYLMDVLTCSAALGDLA